MLSTNNANCDNMIYLNTKVIEHQKLETSPLLLKCFWAVLKSNVIYCYIKLYKDLTKIHKCKHKLCKGYNIIVLIMFQFQLGQCHQRDIHFADHRSNSRRLNIFRYCSCVEYIISQMSWHHQKCDTGHKPSHTTYLLNFIFLHVRDKLKDEARQAHSEIQHL